MNYLNKNAILEIERQMFNKGRDIDVAIFNSIIDDSSKEFVLDCLMMYMNRDGGIGNALHIDNYNPNSSVYQCYEALRILDALGFDSNSEEELLPEIVNKICNYIYNRCQMVDGVWNPVEKTNDDFAHSELFSYTSKPLDLFGYHPTAAIVGYTLTLNKPTKAYYKKALKLLPSCVDYFIQKEELTHFDFISFNSLLGSLKKLNINLDDQQKIEEKLKKEAFKYQSDIRYNLPLVLSNCELDDTLKELVDNKLDELINSRASHGMWEHNGDWGSNRYPEADSAMLKWLGSETVNNMLILARYGRIE